MLRQKISGVLLGLLGACSLLTQTALADSSIRDDALSAVEGISSVAAPEVPRVIVQGASPAPNIGYLALYVADARGYFDQQSLDVKINYSHGDAAPLQAISTGRAQIMSGTPEALIRGYRNGLRGVLFLQTYNKLIFSVGTLKEGGLESPQSLEGAKVGVSSMASTGVIITRLVAAEAGVDPDTIKFLPVGTGQQALGAISNGTVDALALWDAAYSQIETGVNGVDMVHWKPSAVEDAGDGGYFTTWEIIKEQPNTLARFSRAIDHAMKFISQDPDGALRIYWDVNPSAKPKGDEETALKIGREQLAVVGRSLDLSGSLTPINDDALNRYIMDIGEQSDISALPKASDISTNAFLRLLK